MKKIIRAFLEKWIHLHINTKSLPPDNKIPGKWFHGKSTSQHDEFED